MFCIIGDASGIYGIVGMWSSYSRGKTNQFYSEKNMQFGAVADTHMDKKKKDNSKSL